MKYIIFSLNGMKFIAILCWKTETKETFIIIADCLSSAEDILSILAGIYPTKKYVPTILLPDSSLGETAEPCCKQSQYIY